ncbi:hypothetical protein Q5P01_016355 [Channa striata]|uniref:Pre-mRNA polyadenylation factor Fip1 domain-containing protein n=1 Tax=Channa striata TaxID=64152 RepID=A0AA88SGF9_CHASR|nr:hypothetical protein Q5P01_016355 [Channa striata]
MAWQSDERTICQRKFSKDFMFSLCAGLFLANLDNYSTDDREREDNDQTQSPFSSEQPPVRLQMNAKRTPYTVAGTAKGLDLDALKKPWRRAGADISDYFNYGFDEESWNAYCKKQTKLHAANIELCTKIRKGHDRNREELCCADSFSGSSSIPASRKSTASTDATEGRSRSSRRVEGWQCLTDKGNSTQVITEMSAQEDRITSYHLTPPSNVYTHPPSFPYRREPNHPSPSTALDSGHAKRFKGSSASQYPLPSGLSSLIPRTTVSKACASYAWQKKCDTGRGRSRERGHDKTSKRGRNRETESYSSRNRWTHKECTRELRIHIIELF